MSDASRQLTHALKLLRLAQLFFGVAQGLLGLLAFRYVARDAQDMNGVCSRKCERHFDSLKRTCLTRLWISKPFFRNKLRLQCVEYFPIVFDEGLDLFVIAVEIAF